MKRVLYAIVVLLVAVLMLWGQGVLRAEVSRASSWPTVPGELVERGVGELAATVNGPVNRHYYKVRYRFVVDGKEYTGDQAWAHRQTSAWAEQVQKELDALPNPVPVHYNPKDPTQSCLMLNSTVAAWLILAGGILLLLVDALMWLTVLAGKKS